MIYFIGRRYLKFFATVLFFVSVFLLLDLKFRMNEQDHMGIIFLDFLVFGAPFFFLKTSWMLSLPYSKRKLTILHLLETILFYATCVAMLCLTDLYFKFFRGQQDSYLFLHPIFAMAAIAIYASFPFKRNVSRPQEFSVSSKNSINRVLYMGVYLALIFLYIKLLGDQPFFMICLYLIFLSSAPYTCYRIFEGPIDTSRRFLKYTVLMASIACCSLFLALALIFKYSENKSYTSTSIWILNDIPVDVSEERALYLFRQNFLIDTSLVFKAIEPFRDRISFQDWKIRTEGCADSKCFNVSEKFFPVNSTDSQKAEGLSAMFRKCEFQFSKGMLVRCSGAIMEKSRLEPWLKYIVDSGVVNEWLKDSDPTRQIIAIKSLAKTELSNVQKSLVQELQKSENPMVKAAATAELDYLSKTKKLLDGACTVDKSYCRPKNLAGLF